MTKTDSPKPLPQHADRFLKSAMIKSIRTRETYRYALQRLADFITSTRYAKTLSVSEWRDNLLLKLYEWLTRQDYNPATIDNYLAATRSFLIWLDADDLLPADFRFDKAINRLKAVRPHWSRWDTHQADPDLPRIVTYYDHLPIPSSECHLERLILLRARAIVHTLYASAGRVSEVARLTRDQVLDGRLSEFRIIGKGDRDRVMLLTPQASQAIAAYCKERGQDGYPGLFISHGRGMGKALGRGTLWSIVKHAASALDLHASTSPHSFRHYRAQQLLNDGMSIDVLQALLGHSNISITRRVYAPDTPLAKLRDQFDRFSKNPDEAIANA